MDPFFHIPRQQEVFSSLTNKDIRALAADCLGV